MFDVPIHWVRATQNHRRFKDDLVFGLGDGREGFNATWVDREISASMWYPHIRNATHGGYIELRPGIRCTFWCPENSNQNRLVVIALDTDQDPQILLSLRLGSLIDSEEGAGAFVSALRPLLEIMKENFPHIEDHLKDPAGFAHALFTAIIGPGSALDEPPSGARACKTCGRE